MPACAAMQDDERLGARMLDLLMKGVSTRNDAGVIGAMAGAVGVSKSAVAKASRLSGPDGWSISFMKIL